jgi:hypothetical protein
MHQHFLELDQLQKSLKYFQRSSDERGGKRRRRPLDQSILLVQGKHCHRCLPPIQLVEVKRAAYHIVYYNGHLLALKEDALPNEMDPDTLETIGTYDFDGQYKGTLYLTDL